ncbi:helix-turn-helix domain-containing protein [Mangrovicoccus ximenensis]|uniref:helix-turn-helix domain-containing protein n=1 Tax=Mangrovicoccus ximenensis TaxID=1911570 RepID=UPI000D3C4B40|nr:helix-turn-helix domain-containing protein [Mangrovicoccus ximenensis]
MTALPNIAGEPSARGLPDAVVHYLTHTELGQSIRQIARHAGCHASTISRQVRRFESRRDDPLIDEALDRLGQQHFARIARTKAREEPAIMSAMTSIKQEFTEDACREAEYLRVLRRLAESGAVLAVAKDMERAVVMRDLPDGASARTAVVDRAVADDRDRDFEDLIVLRVPALFEFSLAKL